MTKLSPWFSSPTLLLLQSFPTSVSRRVSAWHLVSINICRAKDKKMKSSYLYAQSQEWISPQLCCSWEVSPASGSAPSLGFHPTKMWWGDFICRGGYQDTVKDLCCVNTLPHAPLQSTQGPPLPAASHAHFTQLSQDCVTLLYPVCKNDFSAYSFSLRRQTFPLSQEQFTHLPLCPLSQSQAWNALLYLPRTSRLFLRFKTSVPTASPDSAAAPIALFPDFSNTHPPWLVPGLTAHALISFPQRLEPLEARTFASHSLLPLQFRVQHNCALLFFIN